MSEQAPQSVFDSGHEAFSGETLEVREELLKAFKDLKPVLWGLTEDMVGEDIWRQFQDGETLSQMERTQDVLTEEADDILNETFRREYVERTTDEHGSFDPLKFFDMTKDVLDRGTSGVDGQVFAAHEKVCRRLAFGMFKDQEDRPTAYDVELYEEKVEFTLPDTEHYRVGESMQTGEGAIIVERYSIDDSGSGEWVGVDEAKQNEIIKFTLEEMKITLSAAKAMHHAKAFKPKSWN